MKRLLRAATGVCEPNVFSIIANPWNFPSAHFWHIPPDNVRIQNYPVGEGKGKSEGGHGPPWGICGIEGGGSENGVGYATQS